MATREEQKWERMRQVLAAGAQGVEAAPAVSQRTLFGIKSSVEEQLERIVAADEARRRFTAHPNTAKAFVFDLDGTLLDTLPDLVLVTNAALAEAGWPERSTEEIKGFVGGGLRLLLQRATDHRASEAEIDALFARWQELTAEHDMRGTRPYPGIPQALAALKEAGCKLGVVSNKVDSATQLTIGRYLPGVFDAVHGEGPGFPRKPDPAGLLKTLDELGVRPAGTAYVGDSPGDMEAAHAAGALPVAVSWGYRPMAELKLAHPAAVCATAQDLLDLAGLQA